MATRHGPKRVIKRPARLDEAPTTAPEPAAAKKKVGKPKTKQVVESVAADPLPAKRASALRKARPVKTPEEQEEAQGRLKREGADWQGSRRKKYRTTKGVALS